MPLPSSSEKVMRFRRRLVLDCASASAVADRLDEATESGDDDTDEDTEDVADESDSGIDAGSNGVAPFAS